MTDDFLYHLVEVSLWGEKEALAEDYKAPSLASEGFIHCSFKNQVVSSWKKHFHRDPNLYVLKIRKASLKSRILVEDTYGSGQKFPHVYGPIEKEAVCEVILISDFIHSLDESLSKKRRP